MATSTAERTGMPPAGLEHKSAAGVGDVQVDSGDEGVVEAIVSVTGVVDRVNDVIEPGAYRGRPIGVWSHDDKMWASRTEDSAELPPGDPRLPAATSDGRPWPAAAGGLWVRTRYNLDTRTGRDAYSNVKFFAGQTGWSIGYRVPPGGSYTRNGVRHIKELQVWEYSPVMVGAASEPMTLSVKSSPGGGDVVDLNLDDAAVDDPDGLHNAAMAGIDWDEVAAADPGPGHDPSTSTHDDSGGGGGGGVWSQVLDAAAPADVPPGVPADEVPPEDLAADAEVKRQFTPGERGKAAKAGAALPDGSYPIETWSDLKNAIQALGRAKDKAKVKAHIIARARALKATRLLPADWGAGKKNDDDGAAEVKGAAKCKYCKDPAVKDVTWDGGSAKTCPAHAGMAKNMAGRQGKKATVADIGAAVGTKAAGGADQNRGGAEKLRDWYVRGGGAAEIDWGTDGDFMRCVGIAGKHMSPENARGWCNLRHQDAVGAPPGKGHKGLLAEWDPAAEVGPDAAWAPPPGDGDYDPPPDDAPGDDEGELKAFPFLDDSYEAAQSLLRAAAVEQFRGQPVPEPAGGGDVPAGPDGADAGGGADDGGGGGADDDSGDGEGGPDYEWDDVAVIATWPDRVVIVRSQDGGDGGEPTRETLEVPYTIDGGQVTFGPPAEVELHVDVVHPADQAPAADAALAPAVDGTGYPAADAAAGPVTGMVDQAAAGVKTLLAVTAGRREVKSGRVLSGSNADKLRAAVQRLLEVLAAAGVDVTAPSAKAAAETKGGVPAGTVLLDPAEYTRGLRLRAGI